MFKINQGALNKHVQIYEASFSIEPVQVNDCVVYFRSWYNHAVGWCSTYFNHRTKIRRGHA